MFFIKQKMALPSYQFIAASNAAKRGVQLRGWLGLYLVLCSPVLIYTALVICIGIVYGYYWTALAACLYNIALFCGLAAWSYHYANYGFINHKKWIQLSLPKVNKPFWTWPFYYLLKEQTIMLMACKILSLLLFRGIIWMFADAGQDIRIYLIAILSAILAHSILIATVLKFERSQLSFVSSFPLGSWSRLLQTTIFFLLLFLPELLIYTHMVHYSPSAVISGIVFCIACLFALRMSLYYSGDDMDFYLRFIFCFFILTMLAILFYQFIVYSLFLFMAAAGYHHYLFYKNRLS
jgi:hypothetical protein